MMTRVWPEGSIPSIPLSSICGSGFFNSFKSKEEENVANPGLSNTHPPLNRFVSSVLKLS
jgi:hypothetical protein